jgi:hypothetical protein
LALPFFISIFAPPPLPPRLDEEEEGEGGEARTSRPTKLDERCWIGSIV